MILRYVYFHFCEYFFSTHIDSYLERYEHTIFSVWILNSMRMKVQSYISQKVWKTKTKNGMWRWNIIPNKMILRSVVWLKEVYSMVDKPHYFSSKYQNRSRKRIPSKKNVYIALFACAIFSDFHLFNSVCRVEKKGARKSEIDGKAKIYMKLSQIAHRTKNMHKKPYESFEYIETMLCTTQNSTLSSTAIHTNQRSDENRTRIRCVRAYVAVVFFSVLFFYSVHCFDTVCVVYYMGTCDWFTANEQQERCEE